ncbi:MAG: prepilin-type N-terminal cleavage/methylation domain-containing protein [Lentimonas sp.]
MRRSTGTIRCIRESHVASPLAEARHQKGARKRARHENNRSAFTLIEVILAIALTGFLLAGATSIVLSFSRIWVDREERNFFEDHVDGVTEFLNASFASAGMEIALGESSGDGTTNATGDRNENPVDPNANTTPTVKVNVGKTSDGETGENTAEANNGGLLRVPEEPIGWVKPPGFADHKDPLINFNLTTTPPLLVNLDDAPTIGVDAFLYFKRDEGLSLLWYSLLQEEAEDTDDLRRTEISPLVTAINYIYWDEGFEKWEEEDEPKEGEGNDKFLLPRFIKLIFEYDGETKERTIMIPVPSTSALLY